MVFHFTFDKLYLSITNKIPIDEFPQERNIIVAAGLYASRGITIQSKEAMFMFTSFIFVNTLKSEDRGADDYQKIGRMTGYYKEEYDIIKPVLLATKKILSSAKANINLVEEKRNISYVHTGEFQKLSEIISQSDWDNSLSSCTNYIRTASKSARIEVPPPNVEENIIQNSDNINEEEKVDLSDKITRLIISWRKSLKQDKKTIISQIYKYIFDSKNGVTINDFQDFMVKITGKKYNNFWLRSLVEKDYNIIFTLNGNRIVFTKECQEILSYM